jgi:hypothetical protein
MRTNRVHNSTAEVCQDSWMVDRTDGVHRGQGGRLGRDNSG